MVFEMINFPTEITFEKRLIDFRMPKEDILDCLFKAIEESYAQATFLIHANHFPFRLQIRGKTNTYRIRAYIWGLTKNAPYKHEFQIQDLGVDKIMLVPGEKTLILGWWKEAGVFAGFDAGKHLGKLNPSYSFQIHETVLNKAYINGFYTQHKKNEEAIIAFTPDFFIDYVHNLERLHGFGKSVRDLTILNEITQTAENNDFYNNIQDLDRRKTFLSLHRRIREINFQKRVLNVYGYRCAFCGSFKSVEAVHIIPVNHKKGTDETRNGLALCALHHKAYEQGLITIIEDYSVILNPNQMDEPNKLKLDGRLAKFAKDLRPIILLPPAVNDRPHIEYIKIANSIRGWK
jgi:putative restriction endonuclease